MKTIRRLDGRGVSPVVAEILLVAIAVTLAAVLYVMATGLLNGPSASTPIVAFTPVQTYPSGSYNATFSVASTSITYKIANYRFNLAVNGSFGSATDFAPPGVPAAIQVGGTTYRVTWTDTGNDGGLNAGDLVTVAANGRSLPRATSFVFYLLWSDGGSLTTEPWTSP